MRPALLRVRLDTLTSLISDIDISDEEEENGIGPLDPPALWVRERYSKVVEGGYQSLSDLRQVMNMSST